MFEWSFQRKLVSGVILVCVLAIVTSAGAMLASRYMIINMSKVTAGEGQDLAEARALQLLGVHVIADVHASLLSDELEVASAARAGSGELRSLLGRMQARMTDPEDQLLLGQVAAAEAGHERAFAVALAATGRSQSGAAGIYPDTLIRLGARLDQALTALVSHTELARARNLAPSQAAISRAESILWGITISTVMLLLIASLMLGNWLSRSYQARGLALDKAERAETRASATLTEVEAASRVKDEFLATVSHELRNPLAPILTWTQLLRTGTLDAERSQRALEIIERNVMSQVQLIDDLVDVSRVVAGKFRLDVRPIDLAPVIRTAADSQGPASEAKHIRLHLVLDERAGMISGDSERVQQVMGNLLSNAIKFTPSGGRVQVVLQRAESHVEVSVIDSGVGMSAEFLPHVFEPFRQATGGSMRRHAGLGLGLSIARHIVELHGGEIHAASDGLNLGSKFTVTFPLLATVRDPRQSMPRHPVARDAPSELSLGRLDGVRVLLVEDEPSASEALHVLFDSCGAQARVAGSAPEAITIFEDWRPDVLVSDIAMPGEDGYSLIRRIRQRSAEHGGEVPAVALTAFAKIEDRVTILSAGFQMYLSKPADPNELIAVVSSLAKRAPPGEPLVS